VAFVFVCGGTGFLGRAGIGRLIKRGHSVRTLSRPGSEGKVPVGCRAALADVFDARTYFRHIPPSATFLHLVGVAHPAPWKARAFEDVDRRSLLASVEAARRSGVRHFVFVSVAQPAPVMKAYLRVRAECEAAIRSSGLNVTILRPWYILGPGRRWPLLLWPLYALFERLPLTRGAALRLGLLGLEEMTAALAWAVENPADGVRVLDVPAIRKVARELV
jgi:uncharacterized protein YbjT (DUF2867 family)